MKERQKKIKILSLKISLPKQKKCELRKSDRDLAVVTKRNCEFNL